jgi:hypothetical protein
VRVIREQWENLFKYGLIYAVGHWLQKPVYYQMRAAASDQACRRIGSASRFIQAPDVGQKQLVLSGMLLGTVKAMAASSDEPGGAVDVDPLGSPAVRMFRPGATLRYEAEILDGRINEMNLYYEVKRVYEGRREALQVGQTLEQSRFRTTRNFTFGREAPAGEWALELIVTDKLAGPQPVLARQIVEF